MNILIPHLLYQFKAQFLVTEQLNMLMRDHHRKVLLVLAEVKKP